MSSCPRASRTGMAARAVVASEVGTTGASRTRMAARAGVGRGLCRTRPGGVRMRNCRDLSHPLVGLNAVTVVGRVLASRGNDAGHHQIRGPYADDEESLGKQLPMTGSFVLNLCRVVSLGHDMKLDEERLARVGNYGPG
jgi:hypothetical protein